MQETQGTQLQALNWEDPLEEAMTTHSSILAWRIPWTEEPSVLLSMGSQRTKHDWSDLARVHAHSYRSTSHLKFFQRVSQVVDGTLEGSIPIWVQAVCTRSVCTQTNLQAQTKVTKQPNHTKTSPTRSHTPPSSPPKKNRWQGDAQKSKAKWHNCPQTWLSNPPRPGILSKACLTNGVALHWEKFPNWNWSSPKQARSERPWYALQETYQIAGWCVTT